MKRTYLVISFLTLTIVASFGQVKDTLIYATGKIFNHDTKEPINAKISYESLPYGNKVGMLSGSTFRFPLYDNTKYSITVEAQGFAPAKYMLDPAAANEERNVIQDIPLGLPASAASTAETTHTVWKVLRMNALIFKMRSSIISHESYPELNTIAEIMHN